MGSQDGLLLTLAHEHQTILWVQKFFDKRIVKERSRGYSQSE